MCWYGTLFFIAWRPGSITCKKKTKHCHHHAKDLYCIKVRIVHMYIGCILDWCIPSSWWTQYLQGAARTCGSTSPKRHPSTTVLHTWHKVFVSNMALWIINRYFYFDLVSKGTCSCALINLANLSYTAMFFNAFLELIRWQSKERKGSTERECGGRRAAKDQIRIEPEPLHSALRHMVTCLWAKLLPLPFFSFSLSFFCSWQPFVEAYGTFFFF